MVIVDTSVWIDFFNGKENECVYKLESLKEKDIDIFTTGIIVTEILSGFKEERDVNLAAELLKNLPFVNPVYPDTYIKAASIYRTGRRKGITIRKIIDCLIAQSAIENNLLLLHKDEDFNQIAGFTELKIY